MKQKFNIFNHLNDKSKPNQNLLNLISVDPELQIHYVSVYDLVPNPKNFYNLSDIESLAGMIEMQHGVKIPLEVKVLPNGKYLIISGHRRRAAVLLLLEKKSDIIVSPTVPVFFKQYENEEMETLALILSNRGQRTRTADEIMEEIERLRPIAQRIYDEQKAKGNITGRFRKFFAEEILQISEAALQRKTQLAKLSPQAKEALDKGTLSMTAASELTGLKPEEQDAILDRISSHDKPVTIKFIQQEKEHVKNTNQQDTTDFELEQEAATLEEVSNSESEAIESELADQENEHVKSVGHQDRNELEPEQEAATLEEVSNSESETIEPEPADQENEHVKNVGHQDRNELEPEQDVAALDHDSSSDNKSVTIRTSEQKEETTRNTGHQHPNHSPEAAISELRKTKAVLLQYQKEIRNGFAETLLRVDQFIDEEKRMDIRKDLSKLELLLASISGEISRMK